MNIFKNLKYRVTQQGDTEPPFSGKYNNFSKKGIFVCSNCNQELFSSNAKYDSGTGWPSFFEAVNITNIETLVDKSHGMIRTEVKCKACNSHLGHLFEDGPKPTGLRYCINSVALDFKEK